MAKRIFREWDEERTALLGQDKLFVQKGKGDAKYYHAWLKEPEVERCPVCGGEVVRIQDLFSKTYQELISEGERTRVIQLQYNFYKWRCLNSDCRHIFAKEIDFASRLDNVTYRLEGEIAHRVMENNSYGKIHMQFQKSISRQAIGQIFNRWVYKKEELRKTQTTPTKIAILSGKTDKDYYTIFISLDNSIKIYDILLGVNTLEIAATIRAIGIENIKTVLSDCNPTIISAIKDNLPDALHIIPVEYWFDLVTDDFAYFSHEKLKWNPTPYKDRLIITPPAELGYRVNDLKRLLNERPLVKKPHTDYNHLRDIISRRDELWVYDELIEWTESVDDKFKEQLTATIMQLKEYRNEIEAHVLNHNEVPEQLHFFTSRLNELIRPQRTFSTEVLRARVLYSTDVTLDDWRGVPIDAAIKAIENMKQTEEHEDDYE